MNKELLWAITLLRDTCKVDHINDNDLQSIDQAISDLRDAVNRHEKGRKLMDLASQVADANEVEA